MLFFGFSMSRMNVKKTLDWLQMYESYWNVLPKEMQDYIVEFKISQENIVEENRVDDAFV